MKITTIDEVQRFQHPTYYLQTFVRLTATSYRGVDLDRLVIHSLKVHRKGCGYGRLYVKSLQRKYDEIHIFPVEARGFWEKCGFTQMEDLPVMTWSRTTS